MLRKYPITPEDSYYLGVEGIYLKTAEEALLTSSFTPTNNATVILDSWCMFDATHAGVECQLVSFHNNAKNEGIKLLMAADNHLKVTTYNGATIDLHVAGDNPGTRDWAWMGAATPHRIRIKLVFSVGVTYHIWVWVDNDLAVPDLEGTGSATGGPHTITYHPVTSTAEFSVGGSAGSLEVAMAGRLATTGANPADWHVGRMIGTSMIETGCTTLNGPDSTFTPAAPTSWVSTWMDRVQYDDSLFV